jgi:hypothetical protein
MYALDIPYTIREMVSVSWMWRPVFAPLPRISVR